MTKKAGSHRAGLFIFQRMSVIMRIQTIWQLN